MSTAAPMQQAKAESQQRNSQHSPQNSSELASKFTDTRPETIAQRRLQDIASNSARTKQLQVFSQIAQTSARTMQFSAVQAMMNPSAPQHAKDDEALQAKFFDTRTAQLAPQSVSKPNNTGLPDHLKSGIESLSGMNMDHVKVHCNSTQPAQLHAHAYAQGSEIHVAPGQEKHVPHEAWHVVQQAQGRVKPTMQMKAGVAVNDDVGLETEADVMGARALGQGAAQLAKSIYGGTAEMQQSASRNIGSLKVPDISGAQRQLHTSIVQRRREDLAGVGSFWVGEDHPVQVQDQQLERLSESRFSILNSEWSLLQAGYALQLYIEEAAENGRVYAGFQAKVLAQLGKLMSRPNGRQVVSAIILGSKKVTIRPLDDAKDGAHAAAVSPEHASRAIDGKKGAGSDVVVGMDPDFTDDTIKAFDADYNEIHQPVFATLGHELIHAKHATEGSLAPREQHPSHEHYDDLEEEETIAGDSEGLSENAIRADHGLTPRFGHKGKDVRMPVEVPKGFAHLQALATATGATPQAILQANPDFVLKALADHPAWMQAAATQAGTLPQAMQRGAGVDFQDWLNEERTKELGAELAASGRPLAEIFGESVGQPLSSIYMASGELQGAIDEANIIEQVGPHMGNNLSVAIEAVPALLGLILSHSEDILKAYLENTAWDVLQQSAPKFILSVLMEVDTEQVAQHAGVNKLTSITNQAGYATSIRTLPRRMLLPGCTTHFVTRAEAGAEDKRAAIALTVGRSAEALGAANPVVNWGTLTMAAEVVVPV